MEALTLLSKFGIWPRGIIHVGANYGQEFDSYKNALAETVLYIEPVSKIFKSLKEKVEQSPGHHAIRAVCSDTSGDKVNFNVASNSGASSSMLELGNHAKLYPDIVYEYKEEMRTEQLDDLRERDWADKDFNVLVIDTQGADLLVLKGARSTLRDIEAIYIEVAEVPLYDGGCTWQEIAGFLAIYGFSLKYLNISPKQWGNAFFAKNKAVLSVLRERQPLKPPSRNLALRRSAKQSSQYHPSKQFGPCGGVSGNKTGGFGFHTALEKNPWWQVDLGKTYPLTEVHVYNRIDMAPSRAFGFVIRISENEKDWMTVHRQGGKPFGGVYGNPALVTLNKVAARFVRIEIEGEGYLHLDEVEVYGDV